MSDWLVLIIGNSRLHWAWFHNDHLRCAWDLPHLSPEAIASLIAHQLQFHQCPDLESVHLPEAIASLHAHLPLWIASVVPAQTRLWQDYDRAHVVTLDHLPIQGLYPSLGIDRALALLGAIECYSAPVLVIDAGTALTLTGADANRGLVGGAILPGVQLQLRSLAQHTAALPLLTTELFTTLPPRWASSTPDAIQSGIIYTVLAGIQDFIAVWIEAYPDSAIAMTGGDGALLASHLQKQSPQPFPTLIVDPYLGVLGMRSVRQL